ncbi:TPA: hypothetical protein ACU92F_007465, partial [Burkholderia contaminans]
TNRLRAVFSLWRAERFRWFRAHPRSAFPFVTFFRILTVAMLKIRKEKKDIRQLRCVDGATLSKIVNCGGMRCTACRRPALRRYSRITG